MANQSAVEQAILELINRARLDPAAEAARFGIALNEGVPAEDTISTASKQPLAMNDLLLSAARGHSQRMIDADFFAHNDPGTGTTPPGRMAAAGYSLSDWAENIAWRGTSGTVDLALQLMLHEDLFVDSDTDERGHRVNMLDADLQEVGVGEVTGQFTSNGTTYNASMLTQDFAKPSGATTQFLTGVTFNDNVVADKFYSVGEARANVTVAVSGETATTSGISGGYSKQIAAGAKTVTFSGGGLPTSVVLNATIATGVNAKIDLMDQSTIRTSVSVAEVSGISTIIGLGTIGLTLTGGTGSETIVGTKGNDTLRGGGGTDNMQGLGGNDFFYVDNAADVVNEALSGGADRVFTTVNYTLTAGSEIETFSTTNHPGTGAINLTGNAFAQSITGNDGANVINGGGGADTMVGRLGNDRYFVDNAADVVNEAAGGGTDQVVAFVSYTLAGGQAIETLSTNNTTGTAAINLSGNGFANGLVGNAGANFFNGGGGSDTIITYGGNDTIRFNSALGASNIDNITDFDVTKDTIQLENAIFTALTTPAGNPLNGAEFFAGSAAQDANDRIIYNSGTGALLYDFDGTGGAGAKQFATLATGLGLTSGDFFVV